MCSECTYKDEGIAILTDRLELEHEANNQLRALVESLEKSLGAEKEEP